MPEEHIVHSQKSFYSEISTLNAEIASVDVRVGNVERSLVEISRDLKALGQQPPRAPIVIGAISLMAFILTIMGLTITPISTTLAKLSDNFHTHTKDGHPAAVRDTISHINSELNTKIGQVVKNQDKISELELRNERRMNNITQRLSNVETMQKERAKQMEMGAVDRLTAKQQSIYEDSINQRLGKLDQTDEYLHQQLHQIEGARNHHIAND